MGLDMYLTGEQYFHGPRTRGDKKSEQFDLGYWRKHPNLHGFIVRTFAGGIDECQEIELSPEGLREIIGAITARQLPPTTGFFFGVSDDTDEQVAEDLEIFGNALEWLETEDPDVWRAVAYRARW